MKSSKLPRGPRDPQPYTNDTVSTPDGSRSRSSGGELVDLFLEPGRFVIDAGGKTLVLRSIIMTPGPEEPVGRDRGLNRPTTTRSGRENLWLPWAAAVLLFIVSLALTWQVARLTKAETMLRAELDRSAVPRPNIPLVFLDGSHEEGAVVSSDGQLFVLVVTPETTETFPEYRVTVTDLSGRTVQEVEGLELSDRGRLRLGLAGLPEGMYQVTAWGFDGEEQDPTEAGSYRLRVR